MDPGIDNLLLLFLKEERWEERWEEMELLDALFRIDDDEEEGEIAGSVGEGRGDLDREEAVSLW